MLMMILLLVPVALVGASKPIIDTRETETVATVKNGETVIIAGLMQDLVRERTSKFPILGDVPYLGKLFRQRNNGGSENGACYTYHAYYSRPQG